MERLWQYLIPLSGMLLAGAAGMAFIGEEEVYGPKPAIDADNVVMYTEDGYKPIDITVEKGDTVVWVSEGPRMWTASNSHPTHADYGLDDRSDPAFDQREHGQVFRFTFEKRGEWQYHNHLDAYHHGTVVVE